jgi:dipeptidyl aminopeptidase/acylaminoacyl peptidase
MMDALREMISPGLLGDRKTTSCGFGLRVGDLGGRRKLAHADKHFSFGAFLSHYPDGRHQHHRRRVVSLHMLIGSGRVQARLYALAYNTGVLAMKSIVTATLMRPTTLRRAAALLLCVHACSALAQQASPERLLEYRNFSDVKVSPDGRRVAFVVTENDLARNAMESHLWVAELAGERSYQLTRGAERAAAPAWSPDGTRLGFLSDRGGAREVWIIAPDGGEAQPALPQSERAVTQFRWLPDGGGFLLLAPDGPRAAAMGRRPGSGPRGPGASPPADASPAEPIVVDAEPSYQRLYRFPLGSDRPEQLTRESFHVLDFDVSADGARVVMSTQSRPGPPNSQPSELRLQDLGSGETRTVITQPTPIDSPRFSPDGRSIAFLSNDHGSGEPRDVLNNTYLQVIRPDGSERRVLSGAVDEDVLGFEWAGDGRALHFWVFERTGNMVYRVPLASGEPRALEAFGEWALERGEGPSFSRDGRRGAVAVSNAQAPAEIHALEGGGRALRRLTDFNQAFAALAPQTEVVRYDAGDGLPLEALVVKPRDFEAGRRYPLLVVVHGGPPAVFTNGFNPRRNVYPIFSFAEAGYVLLLPNPRGSTGYGERFRRANIRDLGRGDFLDIMAGVDLLIEQGVADPDRLGMMGWSYGGQMAYWALTHTDRFKAISAGAGIVNLASHHGTGQAKGYGQHDAYWGATPWEDPPVYIEHSALFDAEHAKAPLLIQHGEKDPIVPVSQAYEFHAAAKRVGLPVEMVVYPGQGHGIDAPKLALDALKRNLDWFNRWLPAR